MSKHVVHLADFIIAYLFISVFLKTLGIPVPLFYIPRTRKFEKSCIMKENHLRVLGMLIGTSKGLPGEFLLLFAVLIWVLFFLIYLGNRQNKLNRWCFISGMCFSMGAVSYTHLDVYKRQSLYSTKKLPQPFVTI